MTGSAGAWGPGAARGPLVREQAGDFFGWGQVSATVVNVTRIAAKLGVAAGLFSDWAW